MTTPARLASIVFLTAILIKFPAPELAHSNQSQTTPDSSVELISYDDGPHIHWQNDTTASILYFIDGEFIQKQLERQPNLTFQGFANDDTITYTLRGQHNTPDPHTLSGASKILALSDIHGEYEYFVDILQKTSLIDSARHWIWGDGHLVIVGDVFDRGDKVTECLWLIYQLEIEARSAGGAVHYLLGNHEMMILRDDLRYVNEKYTEGISRRNRINYTKLFGPDMELGRWLRTKNTVFRLGEILFVHGGISPTLVDSAFNLSEINNRVRELLDLPAPQLLFNPRSLFLTKSFGPLWYRGYHYEMENKYERAMTSQLESILRYFDAKTVVVGHTGVDSVSSLYDGRVYAVDIPFEDIHALEALLWNKNGFFRVTATGELRQL